MGDADLGNLIIFAVVLALTAGLPALLPRLPVPGVVLEVLAGTVVGPQVLGWAHPGPVARFLSDFGLAVLFLMAGFEMDPAVMRGPPINRALAGWLCSAVLALAASLLLAAAGLAGAPALTALTLTTTAIGTLMPVLRDGRLLGPPYGPFVLAAGAIGEAAPVIVLSLLLARAYFGWQALIMLAFAAGATAAVLLAARARAGYLRALFARTMHSSGQLPMRLALAIMILLVVLAERLNIDLVLGAFIAGAVMRAALGEDHRAHMAARLDGIGSAFVVPVFFIASGARLDVAALFSDWRTLLMVPLYALLMLLVRGLPAALLYRGALGPRQRASLALHLGTQISLVVAITAIATERGLMAGSQAAALVGGGVLTTMLYPEVARRVLRAERAAAPRLAPH
ncbi:MAG TPA: cation:proton antiporter [Acetobacteraceae bacterium]|nr:cation:proton antiporter [Acetobacteraceae bacterium]